MMPTLHDVQKSIGAFVLSPISAGLPLGLAHADGLSEDARLSIHRNNTLNTLTESLAAVFPVVHRLVGDDFFTMTARDFIRRDPPRSGALVDFGAVFPLFLETYDPASTLAYLPDVARLEWAWHESFHAADAVAISPESLAAVAAEDAEALRLFLHPSLRLVRSRYPIHRIWEVNQPGRTDVDPVHLDEGGVWMMVLRNGLEVAIHLLDAPLYAFAKTLCDGGALGSACTAAAELDSTFNPGPPLGRLLAESAVTGFVTDAGN